jgi:hypothetical protein
MEINTFRIIAHVQNEQFNKLSYDIAKIRGINVEDVKRLLFHNIITIDALTYLVGKARSNVARMSSVKATTRGKLVEPVLKRVEDIWRIPEEKHKEEKPGPVFIEINDSCINYIKNCLNI